MASTAQGAPGAGTPESNSGVLEEQLKLMSWRMCLSAHGSGDQSPRTRKPQFCCASQPPGSDHSKDLLKALLSSNTSKCFIFAYQKNNIYICVCVCVLFLILRDFFSWRLILIQNWFPSYTRLHQAYPLSQENCDLG